MSAVPYNYRCTDPISTSHAPSDTPNILNGIPLSSDLLASVAPLAGLYYKEYDENGILVEKRLDGQSLRDEVEAAIQTMDMEFGPEPPAGTTIQGLATIRVYSGKTMFSVVNSALRSSQRSEATLRPLLPFLKLLLHTLRNLPKEYHYQGTVYRSENGVHPKFAARYKPGRKTSFFGFTSCTTKPDVLSQFGAKGGTRTVFQLEVTRAYRIDPFSNFCDEEEILLEPCATFEVTDAQIYSDPTRKATLQAANVWNDNMEGLHEVKAVQIDSVYELLKTDGEVAATSPSAGNESSPGSYSSAFSGSTSTPQSTTSQTTGGTNAPVPSSPAPQALQAKAPPTPLRAPPPPFSPQPALQPPPPLTVVPSPETSVVSPAFVSPSPVAPPSSQGCNNTLQSSPPPRSTGPEYPQLTEYDRQCIAQLVDMCSVPEFTAVDVYLAENRNLANAAEVLLGNDPANASSKGQRGCSADPAATAQFNMGCMYDRGEGVPRDDKLAAEWYEKVANGGIVEAMFNMGNMCCQGRGVPQDFKRSVEWYEKAANRGLARAYYRLGVAYERGEGVAQSLQLAAKYYELAAENGVPESMFNIGNMYSNGRGVERDLKKAAMWWERASEQGFRS